VVSHLADTTRAIREYLDSISRAQRDEDRVLRDAVLYRLLLLGEIASALPESLRDRYPDVAWRHIRAFRNLAVHRYGKTLAEIARCSAIRPELGVEKRFESGYGGDMASYMPPGWPAGVHPPGSEDFESTAIGWLLDVVPPDYRLHGVLRRYPVALAAMARYHAKACVEGAREGYRTARTELAGTLPPHAVDTVLAAYRKEGARLAATARAVGLVERALRGETFTPTLASQPEPPRPAGGHRT
jgi:uncharacterized protein with HEPN domain